MLRARWLVGFVLFWTLIMGAVYGLVAAETPWWSWVCIVFAAFFVLRAIPGRIRNGRWGASPNTSAWEKIKAEDRAKRHDLD